jgi:hypothetical protein
MGRRCRRCIGPSHWRIRTNKFDSCPTARRRHMSARRYRCTVERWAHRLRRNDPSKYRRYSSRWLPHRRDHLRRSAWMFGQVRTPRSLERTRRCTFRWRYRTERGTRRVDRRSMRRQRCTFAVCLRCIASRSTCKRGTDLRCKAWPYTSSSRSNGRSCRKPAPRSHCNDSRPPERTRRRMHWCRDRKRMCMLARRPNVLSRRTFGPCSSIPRHRELRRAYSRPRTRRRRKDSGKVPARGWCQKSRKEEAYYRRHSCRCPACSLRHTRCWPRYRCTQTDIASVCRARFPGGRIVE